MFDRLEDRLTRWDPRRRRRFALHVLVWSFVAGVVNLGAYFGGLVTLEQMAAVTLTLSWFAVTITAADIVCTTDVRAETD
jgi:hypothetical protein